MLTCQTEQRRAGIIVGKSPVKSAGWEAGNQTATGPTPNCAQLRQELLTRLKTKVVDCTQTGQRDLDQGSVRGI